MERNVARFFPTANASRRQVEKWGFVQRDGQNLVLIRDAIQKEVADSVLFIQQSLELSSVNEVWQTNIYDFCRLMQQAQALHAQKLRAIEKANQKKDAGKY